MPERRRYGTAKLSARINAIADVTPVEQRLTALAHPCLTCRRESMSEASCGGSASGAIRRDRGQAAALGVAGWLGLAAAPTFAFMALLTCVGGGPPDMLCSVAQDASPLSGMVPMYLLMSAFHSAPWLKLISGREAHRPAEKNDDRPQQLLEPPWQS